MSLSKGKNATPKGWGGSRTGTVQTGLETWPCWFVLRIPSQFLPLIYFRQLCCPQKKDFIEPLRSEDTGRIENTITTNNNSNTTPAKTGLLNSHSAFRLVMPPELPCTRLSLGPSASLTCEEMEAWQGGVILPVTPTGDFMSGFKPRSGCLRSLYGFSNTLPSSLWSLKGSIQESNLFLSFFTHTKTSISQKKILIPHLSKVVTWLATCTPQNSV